MVTAPTRTGLATMEAVPRRRVTRSPRYPAARDRDLPHHPHRRYGVRARRCVSHRTRGYPRAWRRNQDGPLIGVAGICSAMIEATALNMLRPATNASRIGLLPLVWNMIAMT